jgi:hypothetical protein
MVRIDPPYNSLKRSNFRIKKIALEKANRAINLSVKKINNLLIKKSYQILLIAY